MKISDDKLFKEALCQVYRGVQNTYLTAQKHEERIKKIIFLSENGLILSIHTTMSPLVTKEK